MEKKKEMGIIEYLLLLSFILIMLGTFGFGADGKHIDKMVIIGMCMTGVGFLIIITIMVIGFAKIFRKERQQKTKSAT
jgi:arginine exporter protein ArgO